MYSILIDQEGYIDNPHSISASSNESVKLWGAVVCRRGSKVRILSFLDKDSECRRVNVCGVPRGVYLAFGANGGQERSLYLVSQVTETIISLRPVDVAEVPGAYDMEPMAPTNNYILAARQSLLELQMEDLRNDVADLRSGYRF